MDGVAAVTTAGSRYHRGMSRDLLVSACLLGRACRYDGGTRGHDGVSALADAWRAGGGRVVPVCPEELGGLGTPRPAASLRRGDGAAVLRGKARVVREADGGDVTRAFIRGAHRAAAQAPAARAAVLKARSPSCGCSGTNIDGAVRPGDGVFAALLRARGLSIQSEADLETSH